MMKRLKMIVVLCMLLALLPTIALAKNVTQNQITYSLDDANLTAKVTGNEWSRYQVPGGSILIPDEITVGGKTYRVTTIGSKAFYMKTYQTVEIGAYVEKIESEAFGTSFDSVKKIQFNGGLCQDIAAKAFDWMEFDKDFQLIVVGKQGCMDGVLANVNDLKGKTIIYEEAEIADETADLQTKINNAPDGQETVIIIDKDYTLTETLRIPARKKIILKDDGTQRTLAASLAKDPVEMFSVEKDGELTFDGDLIFKGGETQARNKGNIVHVFGRFTLKQGKLCDGVINGDSSGAVLMDKNATFTMEGGSIENFKIEGGTLYAAVVVQANGQFDMTGGTIRKNVSTGSAGARCGGGVLLYTWEKNDKPARMNLSGNAVIEENRAPNGGGVYLIGKTEMKMTGGWIRKNEAYAGHGGGVCVAGASTGYMGSENEVTRFEMDGGVIEGNSAANSGGGIYVNSQHVTLRSGKIQNNKAHSHGGGVYVSMQPFTAQLYDAVITENTAKEAGGGLWFCPTGKAIIYVSNGAAIYKNMAEGAGDDFASIEGRPDKTDEPLVQIAERMLGGGRTNWYQDGKVIRSMTSSPELEWMEQGKVDPSVPRYNASNPVGLQHGVSTSAGCAFKNVPDNGAVKLAETKGRLWITGNTAYTGGGVGSNGSVIFGEKDVDEYELRILKEWDHSTPPEIKKGDVTIQLVINNEKLDTVVLNQGNDWKASFTGLLKPAELTDYTVVEKPIENFEPEISKTEKELGKVYQVRVKNKFVPKPTPTATPTATPTVIPSPSPTIPPFDPPKTGDDSGVALWMTMMLIAGGGLIALLAMKKTEHNK